MYTYWNKQNDKWEIQGWKRKKKNTDPRTLDCEYLLGDVEGLAETLDFLILHAGCISHYVCSILPLPPFLPFECLAHTVANQNIAPPCGLPPPTHPHHHSPLNPRPPALRNNRQWAGASLPARHIIE